MKYDNEITGTVIRELRKKRGVSQEVLSGFACISRSHLAMIENGTKNPNVDTLWRIAEALGMPLSDLLALIESEISKKNEQ
ncbi:MAG: helix-turn-helix transcriptional regulator [Clostridia bacterium]|nr:helix-turn-helix transcriptional regulator [Clostridia bacterium]